ncbi:DUF4278 domain-containing protein [Myxacorys almedinensis]|uniref:DUF4278 domain-containing protein n=1 Tax=Myxacorys almedinensis A TaxID=2690445 RepID=A0A8J7Z4M8_9CYAN|nr:DUF4278 domain-containing protein [Myxacorys almedinensis]NDJ18023.1 DUF4278 domain-containing protein [Myxacorys almedinensis A]
MKLTYRGSTYEADPTHPSRIDAQRFDSVREPFVLAYRGSTYRFDPTQPAQTTYIPRSAYQLSYRGDRYYLANQERMAIARSTRSVNQPVSVPDRISYAIAGSRDLAAVHRANLERNLQRRIQIAEETGDQALLALLEAEQRQLV